MAAKTVVIQKRQPVTENYSKDFTFTPAMMPSMEGASFLREYRTRAWEAYENYQIPAITDEAWRRTDLKNMRAGKFRLVEMDGRKSEFVEPGADLLQPLAGDRHGGQITLLPGESRIELDPSLSAKGLIFTDLITAEKQYPERLEKIIGQIVRPDEGKFAAMTAALGQAGVFVYVPKGLSVEQPLHSVLWGPGRELAFFSHILVYLEEGSSLTYVHEAASPTEAGSQAMHAGIVEIHVGEAANLRFVELQSWGEHVWNFSHERARVSRSGNLDWIFGAVGSHVTKNFSDLDLTGEGAVGRMSGFYFSENDQHFDHDTQQNHLAPHTTSDLLFKGALKDQSRSVWQGMIYVAPGAQKTDGYQANRNLVLSPKARADSIPGLEILADDVRCTHGATVGKIDADQVFYLRSRGMPYADAERLVVEGFFDPIMQRIPFEGVRSRFQDSILRKMG
jgi:Fe-S cluster assembly protein SufD